MFRDVYTTIRPMLESLEDAAYVTAEVLDTYAMTTAADLDGIAEMDPEDALDVFLDGAEVPFSLAVEAAVSLLTLAGVRDLNPPIIEVPGTSLYIGGDMMLDTIENVVPGRWSVLHTSEFTAIVCEDVVFDESEGHFDVSDHDASDRYGVYADTTAAAAGFDEFGPSVTPDYVTIRSTLPRFKAAAHRRLDGRCDAIFLTESRD